MKKKIFREDLKGFHFPRTSIKLYSGLLVPIYRKAPQLFLVRFSSETEIQPGSTNNIK